MELYTFIYWASFLSMLFGWLSRQTDLSVNKDVIQKNDILAKALLAQTYFSCIFVLTLNTTNNIADNKWSIVFPSFSTLISVEFIWLNSEKIRKVVTDTITFKMSLLILAIAIHFYSSSQSSSYIEQLTGSPVSVFSTFDTLITFCIAFSLWVIVVQISCLIIGLVYIIISTKKWTTKLIHLKYSFH